MDSSHTVIEPRLRDLAAFHLRHETLVQRLPVVGNHEHVDTGIERLRAAKIRAAGNLSMPVPVADDEAVESHSPFEHVCEEFPIAVHLAALPTALRNHDGLDAGFDRVDVTARMNIAKLRL